jgi:hypothetical protein
MSEFSEYLQDSIHKISQTVLSNQSPRSLNVSLVNDRIYSPLPSYSSKTQLVSPKRFKKQSLPLKKNQTNKFKLPGMPADFKELLSPFAIRTRDYSVLYSHYLKQEQELIHFPAIKPRYQIFKSPKKQRSLNCPENIASKKLLISRKQA